MWRKFISGTKVNTSPSLLLQYRKDVGVGMQVEVDRPRPSDPEMLIAFEERDWLKRLLRRDGLEVNFRRRMEDAATGGALRPTTYVSDGDPWLPAPNTMPGQTKWRFRFGGEKSGHLIVTTANLALMQAVAKASLSPSISAEVVGLSDIKVSTGELTRQTVIHTLSSIDDPQVRVELLLPWPQGDSPTLGDIVHQYNDSLPQTERLEPMALSARMEGIGLDNYYPPGWQVSLEGPPTSLPAGGQATIIVAAASARPGRVLAAVRVTNLDVGTSVISDLMEFEHL
jgi:hypothetical protein